jgi:hypothetical protein
MKSSFFLQTKIDNILPCLYIRDVTRGSGIQNVTQKIDDDRRDLSATMIKVSAVVPRTTAVFSYHIRNSSLVCGC